MARKGSWRWLRPDLLAFFLAVTTVAYVGGMALVRYDAPPYRLVKRGLAAMHARSQAADDRLPPALDKYYPTPGGPVVRTLAAESGTEPLLMAGGFYHRLDQCPRFGCLAWVMDRQGRVLHAWPAPDPAAFFDEAEGFSGRVKPENFFVAGVAPDRDGSIVVTFHGRNVTPYQVGMARFGRDGRLLWRRFDNSHHTPAIGEDGSILSPFARIAAGPEYFGRTFTDLDCETEGFSAEGVRVVSRTGEVLHELDLTEAIARADFPGLIYSVRDGCDPFHVNGVAIVNEAGAARLSATQGELGEIEAGDLLLSLREQSALLVLDRETGDLRRVIKGRTSAQHSPQFMPDGRIVVFDNLGGSRKTGGSRILMIDPENNSARTIFPTGDLKGLGRFSSPRAGAVTLSADGKRMLVAESQRGRLIEVDVESGKPLWVYENLMDFGPELARRGEKRDGETFVRPDQYGAFYVTSDRFDPATLAALKGAMVTSVGNRTQWR